MRVLPATAVLAACLVLASACTSTDDEPPRPSVAESASPEASPTVPATTGAPTPATPTTSPTLEERLLETGAVPGLHAAWQWQDGETGPADAQPFGTCARVDLASIGAVEVVERTYFPPDDSDDYAAQQVAEFADATSASQAWSVLAAWRRTCGRTVSADIDLEVRPMTAVPAPAGEARWYLISWSPPGEETGRFEAVGMVRNDTRITVLLIANSGQDYDYPAGKEPMVGMVKAAAATLA